MVENKRNIYLIYTYTFLSTFILYYTCDTLFFIERGLTSSLYISFVTITFFIQMILEIPSGIIADKYSKKKILLFGNTLFILVTIIFIISRHYYMFVIAVIINAINNAIQTGIVNSMLYEEIKNKEKFNTYLFRNDFFLNLSYMLAMIVGGLVAQKISLIATYYLTLIPFIINFIIILLIKERNDNTIYKNTNKINIEILKNAVSEIKSSKIILNVILTFSVLFSIIKLVEESHPEYASNIGISVFWIGIYVALILFFSIIGSYIGSKINKKNYKYIINFNSILCGICIMLLGLLNNKIGIFFLLIMYIFSQTFENISYSILHNNISSKSRVTVESILSIVYSIFGVVLGIFMSVLLKYISLPKMYVILGLILIVYSFCSLIKKYLINYYKR